MLFLDFLPLIPGLYEGLCLFLRYPLDRQEFDVVRNDMERLVGPLHREHVAEPTNHCLGHGGRNRDDDRPLDLPFDESPAASGDAFNLFAVE
jgi:hypothetical protein